MPTAKGFLSVPEKIGSDFGTAFGSTLGAEISKAIAAFGAGLQSSTLHIAVEVAVRLDSAETTIKTRVRRVKK